MNTRLMTAEESTLEADLARARRKQTEVLEMIRLTGKDGRHSLGMIEDTAIAREAFALGEVYRRSQTSP